MRFEALEREKGREATGRWSWLIPPLSPATTPIWHRSWSDAENKPCYSYQQAPYGP